jgi:hypothetical protein
MKTITNKFIWITVAALAAIVWLFAGCVTSPQGKAYQTLKDTQTLVDGGMKYYAKQCALGKVSLDRQAKIDDAHFKYRIAFRTAVNLARLDYSKLTPDEVKKLADELLNLIAQI